MWHRSAERFRRDSPLVFQQVQFSSVQSLSRVWLSATPWIAARRASRPSPTPGVYSKSCPSSWWCYPAISSSVVPFSSCPQSLPASGSFPMSQLFAWGGQNVGVSALASVLPKNTQDWSPLEWTGWISLQSKGLSRVFFNMLDLAYLLVNCARPFKIQPHNLHNVTSATFYWLKNVTRPALI